MDNRWATYEANVQSYRSNMIASQSFLLAAGVFAVDKIVLECACVAIALIQLWYIWFRVIRVRTIICDFHKFNFGNKFSNCGQIIDELSSPCTKFLDEDTYVTNRQIRRKVNASFAKSTGKPKFKHNMRQTRIKLDLLLPISFTILWLVIFFYSIIEFL